MNHYQKKMDKDKINDLEKEAVSLFGYKVARRQYGRDSSRFTVDDKTKTIYPSLASVKGIGQAASEDIAKISTSGLDNFPDIYLSIKGTKINKSVFSNLISIGYFDQFGTMKQLDTEVDIIDSLISNNGFKKILKKSEWDLSNLHDNTVVSDLMKSGKHSNKQWKILDGKKLVHYLCGQVPSDDYPISQRCMKEIDILGYCDITDQEMDWRYALVTDVNDKYTPKINLYCLNKGKTNSMKIKNSNRHKDEATGKWKPDPRIKVTWKQLPLQKGDLIYINDCFKDNKMKKVDDKWVKSDQTEWILSDFSLISRDEEA